MNQVRFLIMTQPSNWGKAAVATPPSFLGNQPSARRWVIWLGVRSLMWVEMDYWLPTDP